MISETFDKNEHLPHALQERLDSWRSSPPRSQYQAYGPLNAYLQAYKFHPSKFLVKPQKLLRKEAILDDPVESDDENDASYMDVDEVASAMNARAAAAAAAAAVDGNDTEEEEEDNNHDDGDNSDGDNNDDMAGDMSFDSSGVAVSNKSILLPDFSVEEYTGADTDANPDADTIRVVIEVASVIRLDNINQRFTNAAKKTRAKSDFRMDALNQLNRYLERSAQKHTGRILGVAILGNRVSMRRIRRFNNKATAYTILGVGSGWISMFDDRFVEQLNIMRDL